MHVDWLRLYTWRCVSTTCSTHVVYMLVSSRFGGARSAHHSTPTEWREINLVIRPSFPLPAAFVDQPLYSRPSATTCGKRIANSCQSLATMPIVPADPILEAVSYPYPMDRKRRKLRVAIVTGTCDLSIPTRMDANVVLQRIFFLRSMV